MRAGVRFLIIPFLRCRGSAIVRRDSRRRPSNAYVRLEHLPDTVTDDCANASLMKAAAVLAELQPATATEALLAAQMVGTYRTAMLFLANATKPEESFDGRDRNVLRALRLMRLFTEQTETMARLKGTGGQQRVVVEHVTVNAGGKGFCRAVMPGGRGVSDDNPR